jgi:hypothetical protein
MLARIMRGMFGGVLVCAKIEGVGGMGWTGIDALPSPEELKGRVLLKVRVGFVAVRGFVLMTFGARRRRICMYRSMRGRRRC